MGMIEVTRAQVVKAIETEPSLKPGTWVQDTYDAHRKVDRSLLDPECKVCAVGAVMRSCLATNQCADLISDAGFAAVGLGRPVGNAHHVAKELEAGNYMAALSCYFEGHRGPDEKRRADTVAFVRKNFPPRVSFDIDGTKAKRGIKRVRSR